MGQRFLTIEEIKLIHESQIALYGGRKGVRDQKLLESAVNMAQAGTAEGYLQNSIFEMASAYVFHIGQDQPFVDGNKRTGIAAAHVFLYMNNFLLDCEQDLLVQTVLDMSAKLITKRDFATFLEAHSTTFEVNIW